jgi:hypothetical protein
LLDFLFESKKGRGRLGKGKKEKKLNLTNQAAAVGLCTDTQAAIQNY